MKNKPVNKLYFQPLITNHDLSNIHLRPLSELDRLRIENQNLKRQNQMLIDYIKALNQKLIPQQQMKINKLRTEKNATKQINSKRLVDGIPEQFLKISHRIEKHLKNYSFDEWGVCCEKY